MSTLTALARSCGTDKADHGYPNVYERYLEPLREQTVTLLEIGVLNGASLCMWREYLPKAKVYGIDLNPECAKLQDVFIGSQTDGAFLSAVIEQIGRPDVIIDDGSHRSTHQETSFRLLFPRLVPGGFYFVEDVHWGWGERNVDKRASPEPFSDFAFEMARAINLYGKSVNQEWWGDKLRQVGGDVNVLSFLERNLRSVSIFKSLVIFERELRPL